MNTIRSTWYGWATLCVAGGGAYYFAKRQINEDRATRYNKERMKQERLQRLEYTPVATNSTPPSGSKKTKKSAALDTDSEAIAKSTGFEGSRGMDTAQAEEPPPRSKYEGEPFKSKKGDRFS